MTLTTPRRVISLLVMGAAACVVLAAVSSVGAVDIVFGLPLTLFLPGVALVWAVDPWKRQVKGAERTMWSFGSSIGIVILGGLILNLTGGLTRQHWLILTAAVVAVCAIAGWIRGGPGVFEEEAAGPPDEGERAGWGAGLTRRPVSILLVAVLVVAGALLLSQRTEDDHIIHPVEKLRTEALS